MNSGSDALAEHHDDNDHDRGNRPVPEPVHLGCGMRVGALAPLSLDWPQCGTLRRTGGLPSAHSGQSRSSLRRYSVHIIDRWPSWKPLVSVMRGSGTFANGSRLPAVIRPGHKTGRSFIRARHVNMAWCVSRSIRRRVREIVEWSGGASGNTRPRNSRSANESAARQAMARSASRAFEVANQQQPKVAPGRQPRPAVVGVERLAELFDVPVEIVRVEDLIQTRVKRMGGAPRQIAGRHPHRRLFRTPSSFAHRHRRRVVRGIDRVDP